MSMEKRDQPGYAPVSESTPSEDGFEQDDLLYHGPRLYNSRWARARRFFTRVMPFIIGVLSLASYSILVVTATSYWWKKEMLHGPGVIHSPLRPFVQYGPKNFPKMDVEHYSVMGPPDAERDAVWADLTQFFFTEFPREEQARLGRLDEGVQLPNGNYVALYTVNHLLHCLKRLHHSRYPDYYFPNRTEEEVWKGDKHDMHCLEDLVQQVICHADTAPYTSRWYSKDPRPTGNSNIAHECVNWDLLKEEMRRKHVDPWEPGMFVHPVFGPVVTNGKDTKFPERMGFPTDFEHVSGDGKTFYNHHFPQE